ncbi:MAG: matrixin family metalloprotease [Acidobacteriia bacterium]|nr:matrixin family metalloprotease [Terriglobia bacterium]
MQRCFCRITAGALALCLTLFSAQTARGYAFNQIVPDLRLSASVAGTSACPIPAHQLTAAGSLTVQWSTILGTNPVTILTLNQSTSGQLSEIEQVIQQSLNVWTGVSGSMLQPAVLAPLVRSASANICAADGRNSICFDQSDAAFTPGVLAFSRVLTADHIGAQVGSGAPATELGEILDADLYFNPGDSRITFATPQALASSPTAYDLESILTHELGHLFGFSHSAVWSAMMDPFAPVPGTYTGARPTVSQPDAPLGEDDRTGLRVLYPSAGDTTHIGTITGRVLPANPLSLPAAPAGVTGIFGAHVVAVDASSGAVIAGVLGGWSCSGAGPPQFDGSYRFERLAVGAAQSYQVYAEPLNGAVDPAAVDNALSTLCRNLLTDPGWPANFACVVPPVDTEFTTRARTSP